MAYVHIYNGNPTAGGADGNVVSEGGNTNPISTGSLDGTTSQTVTIKLALRCESGEVTSGNVVITPTGTTANRWALSLDGDIWGEYGAALTISSVITTINTIFYAKAEALPADTSSNDISVTMVVTGKVTVSS